MMTRQLPDVRTDKGYQQEARDFADECMNGRHLVPPCRNLNEFPEWLRHCLEKAYLYGANSAIGIGYRLCDNDWKETVNMYKQQIAELQKKL